MTIKANKCRYCGHVWVSRKPGPNGPINCPACKRRIWRTGKDRREKVKGK